MNNVKRNGGDPFTVTVKNDSYESAGKLLLVLSLANEVCGTKDLDE